MTTTSIGILYVEANETPPELRYNDLALKYYTELKAELDNPAHNSTFIPNIFFNKIKIQLKLSDLEWNLSTRKQSYQ